MRLELVSGQIRALTESKPGEGGDSLPRFSPDGARIAFFRGNESHQRVWIMNAAPPHAAMPATSVEGLSYGLAWAGPQGPLLVAADWHGFRALNSLKLATGETRLIGARGARFPDVARDGNIIFESASYRADLWLTDTAEPGKKREALWPSSRYTNQPEFSPDGKQVVFCSNREDTDGIFIGTLGGDARRLPLPAGYRYIRPHWTPDGRHILVVRMAANASRPGEQQAIKIDAVSGQHEILAQAGNAVNAAHVLGNGDLLIGEVSDYAMRIVRINQSTGEKKRLALPLVGDFAVNATSLVYTLPQLSGATRCDIDTLSCAPLKIALNDANRFDWTLAKDAIWYLDVEPAATGRRALHRIDLASGRISRHDFAPSGAGTSLAVSPDGTKLIVMQEAPPAIDLMIARRRTR
jgi:dipeptidyl aminopeptidase/acylaminoacyl peptidase